MCGISTPVFTKISIVEREKPVIRAARENEIRLILLMGQSPSSTPIPRPPFTLETAGRAIVTAARFRKTPTALSLGPSLGGTTVLVVGPPSPALFAVANTCASLVPTPEPVFNHLGDTLKESPNHLEHVSSFTLNRPYRLSKSQPTFPSLF